MQCQQDDANVADTPCNREPDWEFFVIGRKVAACNQHLPEWAENPEKIRKE